jgi:hypothetical protein
MAQAMEHHRQPTPLLHTVYVLQCLYIYMYTLISSLELSLCSSLVAVHRERYRETYEHDVLLTILYLIKQKQKAT